MKRNRFIVALLCWVLIYFFLINSAVLDEAKAFVRCSNNEMTLSGEDHKFQDKIFEPLLTLYKQKAASKLAPRKTSFRSGNVPHLLIWARPFWTRYWRKQTSHIQNNLCPLPCYVIFDKEKRKKADAIVIELRGSKDPKTVLRALRPRNPNQPWIMLSLEPPPLASPQHKADMKLFNGFFNRTMTYRSDSDILLPHGFVVSKEDSKLLPSSWVVPPVLEQKNQQRKLALAFISKNNELVHSNRLEYVKTFQEYAPIDIYGKYGTIRCGSSLVVHKGYNPLTDKCLRMAGEKYLFIFSFENNFCKDYITEKVYNFLHYPIVPVVRGSADYSLHLPPNSYINANEYTPKELSEKLLFLQRNPKEYQKYFEWKNRYQPSTIGGERTFCHLCARLYDNEIYEHKVIEDFEDWFIYKSGCWRPLYNGDLHQKVSETK